MPEGSSPQSSGTTGTASTSQARVGQNISELSWEQRVALFNGARPRSGSGAGSSGGSQGSGATGNTIGRLTSRSQSRGSNASSSNPQLEPPSQVAGRAFGRIFNPVIAATEFSQGNWEDGIIAVGRSVPLGPVQTAAGVGTFLQIVNGGSIRNFRSNYQASLRREHFVSPTFEPPPGGWRQPTRAESEAELYPHSQRLQNAINRREQEGGRVSEGNNSGGNNSGNSSGQANNSTDHPPYFDENGNLTPEGVEFLQQQNLAGDQGGSEGGGSGSGGG